jgi:hypothetical protein
MEVSMEVQFVTDRLNFKSKTLIRTQPTRPTDQKGEKKGKEKESGAIKPRTDPTANSHQKRARRRRQPRELSGVEEG